MQKRKGSCTVEPGKSHLSHHLEHTAHLDRKGIDYYLSLKMLFLKENLTMGMTGKRKKLGYVRETSSQYKIKEFSFFGQAVPYKMCQDRIHTGSVTNRMQAGAMKRSSVQGTFLFSIYATTFVVLVISPAPPSSYSCCYLLCHDNDENKTSPKQGSLFRFGKVSNSLFKYYRDRYSKYTV